MLQPLIVLRTAQKSTRVNNVHCVFVTPVNLYLRSCSLKGLADKAGWTERFSVDRPCVI